MAVRLRFSTIAVLMLFGVALSLTSRLKSKMSALKNLVAYTEDQDTTCSDDIEKILYFLTLGNADIERTEVSEVVIVLGSSGVGKSTLTQFIANETNTLRVNCTEWGACSIIDDSETIGKDLLSRTFLPNLVFHESTQTPFYDMPGFQDNRNESMEIANSFFMQQILEDAKLVKILVLVRFSSFENSAKSNFTDLLKMLVDLIKSPVKFRDGMAIVSTMADNISHENIVGRNTQFLKESLLASIPELFQGDDKYITGSTEIVENWLESDTEHYFDAKYYSYFLRATEPGLLLENDRLRENKRFLEEVVWNRLQFIPKESGDFGLPMSGDAKLKVKEVGLCIARTLATKMDKSAEDLQNYIRISVLNIIDGKQTCFVHMYELITNFTALDFSFDLIDKQPLSTYLQQLLSKVDSLQIPFLDETRQHIEDTLTFIQFIELTNVDIEFDPRLWVSGINLIKGNLIKYFDSIAKELLDATISWFANEAKLMAEFVLTKIESLVDISEKENLVTSEIVKVKNIFEEINSEKRSKNLTEFLVFYLREFDLLRGFPSDSSVPHYQAFSILEMFDDFSWSSKEWTSPSISTYQYPLENERDLTIFLRALFEDLSQPIVQTGEELELYNWWSSQARLTASKFNCFYSKIIVQGFTSPLKFDRSRVKEFLFYKTKARKRLEFLLNFMLRNVYTCPNSSEIIVTGPIISLDRLISRCIHQNHKPASIILLATHKIYANSKLIGSDINSDDNINAILMSPELIVNSHAEIDLSGKVGEEGVDGKPAGTQYSLFQKITTDDGSNSTLITFPNVTGGPGVDGGAGSPGDDSTRTGTNNFDSSRNAGDCEAWVSGYIQIRNYVNDCNSCVTQIELSNCKCYVGLGLVGRVIEINGTSGPQGGKGGNGTDGSCGGAGGQSYYVDANNFLLSPKAPTNGLQGKNGVGGSEGRGGLGGLYGNTLHVTILISIAAWDCYCLETTVANRLYTPSTERGPTGSSGSPGQTCTTQINGKSVNKTLVNYHFDFFKLALEDLSTNEFLSTQAKSFLNLLGSAEPFS